MASKPIPEPLRKPNPNHVPWLLRRIWERLNEQNEHFMGVIVGQEGSGKSHTALRIANTVDPTFTHERVIFDVADLLEELKDGAHEPGHCYVLDEAGVQLGRRTWQDRSQVLANQALQLIRDHNLGLIFTLPRLSEFDSQAQGRLQAAFEIVKKQDGEFVEGKWKFFDPDRMDDTGEIYKKYPRRIQRGEKKRITRLRFTPPDEAVIEPYEDRKDQFQESFYEETISEIRGETADEDGEEQLSEKELAEKIVDAELENVVDEHGRTGEAMVEKDLIRVEYGVSHADARAIKSLLDRQTDQEQLEAALS